MSLYVLPHAAQVPADAGGRHTAYPTAVPGGPSPHGLGFWVESLLSSYAAVVFAGSLWTGACLLAATLLIPNAGLAAAVGVHLAHALARALGFDDNAIRSGGLGCNVLLVLLAIGAFLGTSPQALAIGLLSVVLTVVVHTAIAGALGQHLNLPSLSWAFVLVTWVVLLAVPPQLGDLHLVPAWAPTAEGPVALFLSCLGALVFRPFPLAGALVLVGWLGWSRVSVLHAAIGFGVAMAFDAFPGLTGESAALYVGFNYILAAVALGGVYYVPGPASGALAGVGAALCGLVSLASVRFLGPWALPVLSAPFNLVVPLVLYSLAQRQRIGGVVPVQQVGLRPEEHLSRFRSRLERFQTLTTVPMQLPFHGAWQVTQGEDGEHTHQGPWRHGMDFERVGTDGRRHRGSGRQLSDWYSYGQPVLAAAAGTVVHVVDGLPDNPIGHMDVVHNWGNVVIVAHGAGVFSTVAHLSPGTIVVQPGQRVEAGQMLGACGTSGRAPTPHIHFQLQRTGDVGAPTCPVAFQDVVSVSNTDTRIRREHTPIQGEVLRGVEPPAGLPGRLALPAGHRIPVHVDDDGDDRIAELEVEVDLYGHHALRDHTTGSRLWFHHDGKRFVAFDLEGAPSAPLLALYVALACVHTDGALPATWEDQLEPSRLSQSALVGAVDLLAALLPTPRLRMAYRAQMDDATFVVSGSPAATLPMGVGAVKSEARFSPSGHFSIDVSIGARRIALRSLQGAR